MSSGLYNTHKIDFDTTLDLTRLKPYGDTMNDGKVQTSFTLPVKDDERGEEAARQIAKKMGLEEPNVAYHAALDKEFTFYVVYGSCVHSVNYEDIHVITVESDVMSMEDTNDYIREHIGRKVVMVGASTGHRCPHRGHRRHHEPQGLRRSLRPGALRDDRGLQPGFPGAQ